MNDYDLGPPMAGLGLDAASVSALHGGLAALLRGASLVRQAITDEEEEEEETMPFSSCSSDSSDYFDAEQNISDVSENISSPPSQLNPSPPPPPPSPPSESSNYHVQDSTQIVLAEIKRQIENLSVEDDDKPISIEESPKTINLPRVRRSSSLRTRSTKNEGERKKVVRFADALGLDLNEVRTFINDLPQVPGCAYTDLAASTWDLTNSVENNFTWNSNLQLHPTFLPDGSAHSKLRRNGICLLKTDIRPPHQNCPSVTIDVLVLNLAFDKNVFARFTTNNWRSFQQVTGCWINGDDETDTFRIVIFVPNFNIGGVLEVALCFQCNGIEHWDNNDNRNYVFHCVGVSS